MAATLTIGYGACRRLSCGSRRHFRAIQIVSYLIAGFALFRAGSFIHEITHLRKGELLAFRVAWNIFCGIPMLMPSFFYENHIDHHNSKRHHGTGAANGEYLPLGSGTRWRLLTFWLQVPLLPLYTCAAAAGADHVSQSAQWRAWSARADVVVVRD